MRAAPRERVRTHDDIDEVEDEMPRKSQSCAVLIFPLLLLVAAIGAILAVPFALMLIAVVPADDSARRAQPPAGLPAPVRPLGGGRAARALRHGGRDGSAYVELVRIL